MKLIIFFFIRLSLQIYISPSSGCETSCSGTSSQPYSNLWSALMENSFSESLDIVLLYSSSDNHYLNFNESGLGLSQTLEITGNLSIRPLFCDESVATSDANLNNKCINRNETLTIFIKSEEHYLIIRGSLNIINIIFDGSEDILKYQTDKSLTNVVTCATTKVRCCSSTSSSYSTLYSDVICIPSDSSLLYSNSIYGLFNIEPKINSNYSTISISIVGIENFDFRTSKSFLKIGNSTSILISDSFSKNCLFPDGVISPSYSYNNWNLKLMNIKFSHYNPRNVSIAQEQFSFLSFPNILSSIEISGSIFTDLETRENQLLLGSRSKRANIYFRNCTFSNIKSYATTYQSENIFLSDHSVLEFQNSTFINISLAKTAYFISVLTYCNISFSNSIIKSNTIGLISSSAFFTSGIGLSIFIRDTQIYLNNVLKGYLFNIESYSSVNISDTTIYENLFVDSATQKTLISIHEYSNSAFERVQLYDNQIFAYSSLISLKSSVKFACNYCQFVNNPLKSSIGTGYVMHMESSPTFDLKNSVISSQTCSSLSSSYMYVFYIGSSSRVTFENITFANITISPLFLLLKMSNLGLAYMNNILIQSVTLEESTSNYALLSSDETLSYITNLTVDNSTQHNGNNFLDLYHFGIKNFTLKNSKFIMNNTGITYFLYSSINTYTQYIDGFNIINNDFEGSSTGLLYIVFMRSNADGSYIKSMRLENNRMNYERMNLIYVQQIKKMYFSDFYITNNNINSNLIFSQSSYFVLSNFNAINNLYTNHIITSSNGVNQIYNMSLDNIIIKGTSLISFGQGDIYTISQASFKNLQLFDSALLYGEIGSDIRISNTNFTSTYLSKAQGIISGKSTIFSLSNLIIDDIALDQDTSLIDLISGSTLDINDTLISNIVKYKNTSSSSTEVSYSINLESSTAKFNNIKSWNISYFMLAISSNIRLSNLNLIDLQPYSGSKMFLMMFQSSFIMNGFVSDNIAGQTVAGQVEKYFTIYESQASISNINISNFLISNGQMFEIHSSSLVVSNSIFKNISYSSTSKKLFLAIDGSGFTVDSSVIEILCPVLEAQRIDSIFINTKITIPNYIQRAIDISNANNFFFIKSYLTYFSVDSSISDAGINLIDIVNKISINDSVLTQGVTVHGMLSMTIENSSPQVEIINSVFSDNHAIGSGGGAISIYDSASVNYTFKNSIFTKNLAISSLGSGGKGGAIYLSSMNDSTQLPVFSFFNCTFTFNQAELFGGAIYVYDIPPSVDSTNFFLNNTLDSGEFNNVGSHAIKVGKVNSTSSSRLLSSSIYTAIYTIDSSISFSEVVSGVASFNQDLALLDLYDQVVRDDSSSTLQFHVSSDIKVSTQTIRASKGLFSISDTAFKYIPGESKNITIMTTGIKTFANLPIQGQNSSKTLRLNFRFCQQGELLEPDLTCFECPYGSTHFVLEPNYIGSCMTCPGTMVCNGGSQVYPEQGYYRLNSTSSLFVKCPRSTSCLGGSLNSECAYGYRGHLCANCVQGWGKTRDRGECYDCLKRGNVYFLIVVVLVVIVMTIVMSIKTLLKPRSKKKTNRRGIMMKMLINFSQMVSLVSVIPIEWPSALREQLDIEKTIASSSSDVLSLDCFFARLSDQSSMSKVYIKLLLYNLLPVFACSIALIVWVLIFRYTKRPIYKNGDFVYRISLTFFLIMYYFQPAVINENLALLSCTNLYREDTPDYYLQKDYDIRCWHGTHFGWAFGLAVPSVLFWMIILPYLTIKKLVEKNRSGVVSVRQDQFDFLKNGYSDEFYYWEGVSMGRKYLLILAVNLSAYHSMNLQLFFALYIFWMCYLVQVKFRPYVSEAYNKTEEFTMLCCLIVTSAGVYFDMVAEDYEMRIFLTIIAFGGTTVFMMKWVKDYFKLSRERILRWINKIKTLLRRLKRKKVE